MALVVLDLLLALGAALRLTRFIVSDDIPGQWFLKDPLDRWMHGVKDHELYDRLQAEREMLVYHGADPVLLQEPLPPSVPTRLKYHRYLIGLGCPFCVSVWMAAVVAVALLLAGGAGDAADWWRYPAGFLTLAWLTGHIAKRVGDIED